MPTPTCTCILAKPAGAMGLSTLHTALCMQHGVCPEAGKPIEWKPSGLFFGVRAQQGAVITTSLAVVATELSSAARSFANEAPMKAARTVHAKAAC